MNKLSFNPTRVSLDLGETPITLETGRIAKQAAGAVVVQQGGTMVLVAVCHAAPRVDAPGCHALRLGRQPQWLTQLILAILAPGKTRFPGPTSAGSPPPQPLAEGFMEGSPGEPQTGPGPRRTP